MIEFEGERAITYDERYQKMAPLKDCLHLLADQVFASLPEEARVLVVAAGTGAELLYLAERHPEWTFTAVEPSKTMMSICREKCAHGGVGFLLPKRLRKCIKRPPVRAPPLAHYVDFSPKGSHRQVKFRGPF